VFLRIDLDRILDVLEQEGVVDDDVPLVVGTLDRVEHVFARRPLRSAFWMQSCELSYSWYINDQR